MALDFNSLTSTARCHGEFRHFFVSCRHVVHVVADSCEQEVHGEQEFRDTTQLIEIQLWTTLQATLTRRYATAPAEAPKKSSSTALYLTLTGVAGLGAYAYFFRGGATSTSTAVQKKPPQEKSPLDPENFVDFKLKKVEPYNHNTAK